MKAEMRRQKAYKNCDDNNKNLGPVMLKAKWRKR